MPEIYQASDVEEAVGIATQLQAEGKYNWFRGQTQAWPPYSSAFRAFRSKDPERQRLASRRVDMFFNWVKLTPELASLVDDPDAFSAIAQHYGIPTNYIDFTTQPGVAGFFAVDAPPAEASEEACIYCLDTADLLDLWETMKEFRPAAHLQLVTIDVSNLWRLEAQHGCFLFCDYNWDVDYPMDRILFPRAGYPSWPTKEDIYPPQKSSLELLLDQYFDVEQKILGSEELHKLFEQERIAGRSNVRWVDQESPTSGYHAEALKTAAIPPLQSWSPVRLKCWTRAKVERLEKTIGAPIVLQVRQDASPSDVAESTTYGVRQVLRTRPTARQNIFSWQLRGLNVPKNLDTNVLSHALQVVWNGMRSLPYSDDEIATACGVTTHLFLEGFSTDQSQAVAEHVLTDCFEVEFAAADGSSSRGYARQQSLQAALRADLKDFLNDKVVEPDDVRRVLLAIFNPTVLLEFEKLQAIFARELIPTQVLSRKLVLFSPAHLQTFGLP